MYLRTVEHIKEVLVKDDPTRNIFISEIVNFHKEGKFCLVAIKGKESYVMITIEHVNKLYGYHFGTDESFL